MADEENPLGGGPFGVGPFGPLVGVAVAVATTINAGASVTTSVPRARTLFYQAKIAPPPAPPEVLAPAVATAESFTITTGRAGTRTLFYQAYAKPVYAPPAAVAATVEWITPLSLAPRATPRILAQNYLPFVPPPAPTIAAGQWLPRWQGPPAYHPAPAGGSPFVPREAVLDNTVTPDAWMPRWQKAVPPPRPVLSQPALGYPYEAAVVSNLTTTLEWMSAWQGTKRPLLPLAGGVNVPLPSNLTTTLEWQTVWRGPPSYRPAPQGGSPFVPKEAVLENTVTPDKWLFRFQAAVPVPSVHHTQPVLGYPYAAASNLTTTLEWMSAWQGPPRYWPIKVQALPFVPKADVVDQVTPDKWLQAWRGPPRAIPAQAGGSPFVPKEAVLENTVTPDKWLVRFAKAVPTPKPVPTQPVLGYPYVSQAIVVPYEQWWHQPLSRAAQRPAVHAKPYQPFVPREATAENTQTPDKWLMRWQGPPSYRPLKVQALPFVPKAAIVDVVTPDKWHRDLGRAAPRPPVNPTQPPFVYSPPAAVTLTTTLEWQQPLSVAVKARPVRHTQPTLYLPEVVVAAAVAEAEHFSVTWARVGRKTLFYQAKIAPPYAPIVAPTPTPGPLEWLQAWKGPPKYQPAGRHTQPFLGRPQALFPDADVGGPADEPERVVCILPHSRVAIVPEALRMATVLVDLRVATVPEESRTVETLFSDRDEESNLSTTLPCAAPIVIPEAVADAFQDDAFQDDAFQ